MTVGTGIFLGLASMAVAYLYVQTKDRWRWRFVIKWFAVIVAVPIATGGIWFGYRYVEASVHARPKPITTYADVALGNSQDEVLYAKGMPSDVLVDDKPGESPIAGTRTQFYVSELKSGDNVKNYRYWSYGVVSAGRIDVDFSPNARKVIRVFCYAKRDEPCPPLLGVAGGATEAEVIKLLGAPANAEISTDFSAVKKMSYPKWNVTFLLQQLQVYGLTLEGASSNDNH